MCSPALVIGKVAGQDAREMTLVEDNHVVQALTTDTPDESLHVRTLPWTPWGDQHFFDAHVPHPLPKGVTVNAVPIAQEVPWRLVPGKRLDDLLGRPRSRGMRCDIEVHNATPFMSQDHQDEEDFVRHGGHHKEV